MLGKKLKALIQSNKFKYISYILIGQLCFLIANLYINFKVENRWGGEGFASFSLIKRTTSFIVFPLLIGAGIGIPRFISFLKEKTNQRSLEIFLSGIIIFTLSFSFVALIILFIPEVFTSAFQDTGFSKSKISFVFLIFILSQGIYILLFSYYRGRLEFKYSTILNILIMSFIPVILIFFSENILNYFIELGAISLIILLFHIGLKVLRNKVSFKNIKEDQKKLFLFGYLRVPGEISLYALDFIPVYLVSVFIGLNESGYISMTLLFFKMGAMFFELVGSIVLPYFGKMFVNHDSSYFISKVNKLIKYGFVAGVIVSIPFYFGSRYIIEYFFPSQVFAIKVTQAVFFVFPVYILYILLRNILDIVKTKAYNSINLTIVATLQAIILFVGFYFNNPNIYYKLALLIPYFILGLFTYLTWIKLTKKLKYGTSQSNFK
tara:strand:+ start:9195 stop:10499 length:1305 start_codon:yes stop_codon:yes gene_type:complete